MAAISAPVSEVIPIFDTFIGPGVGNNIRGFHKEHPHTLVMSMVRSLQQSPEPPPGFSRGEVQSPRRVKRED